MKYLIYAGMWLFFVGTSWAECPEVSNTHESLHWSKPAQITSPDGIWVVEVHPVLDTDENQTPVTIRKCENSNSTNLMILQRSAELYWNRNSRQILIIDHPFSGTYRTLLFSVPSQVETTSDSSLNRLDNIVNEAITKKLGKSRHIQFYLPNFVSWRGSSILLTVGGQTYLKSDGPLDSYCYGIQIRTDTLRIENILPEAEIKNRTGRSCQISP